MKCSKNTIPEKLNECELCSKDCEKNNCKCKDCKICCECGCDCHLSADLKVIGKAVLSYWMGILLICSGIYLNLPVLSIIGSVSIYLTSELNRKVKQLEKKIKNCKPWYY